MKHFYLLITTIFMANLMFAQPYLQKWETQFESLPDGTTINVRTGEIQESESSQNPFTKPGDMSLAAVKSANRHAAETNRFSKSGNTNSKTLGLVAAFNRNNAAYNKEKIDKIESYSAQTEQYYGLKLQETTKTIYQIDGNGNLVERTILALDPETEEYRNAQRVTYIPNAEGNLMQSTSYFWFNEAWQLKTKDTIVYDDSGNTLSKKIFNYTDNKWAKNIQHAYTYHSNGQKASSTYNQNWSENREMWLLESRSEYNEEGNITLNEYKTMNEEDVTWRNYSKREYTYQEDGSIVELGYTWDAENQEPIVIYSKTYKYEDTYDGEKLVERIILDYNNETYKPNSKRVYNYDQWGYTILEEYYHYAGDDWQIDKKYIREFTENGMPIKYQYFVWDATINALREDRLQVRTSNADGNIICFTSSVWNPDMQEMTTYFKDEYTYPSENEKITKHYTYDLIEASGELSLSETLLFSYDSITGRYDGHREEFVKYPNESSRTEYIYNDKLQLSGMIYYNKNGEIEGSAEYYYDAMGRDSLSMNEYLTINTTYENENDGKTVETEYHVLSYNGNIDSEKKYIKHWDNGKLLLAERYKYNQDNSIWELRDSTVYSYCEEGKILSRLSNNERYEYSFAEGKLSQLEYYKDGGDWELEGKGVYIIDTTVSPNNIQNLPTAIADYEWYAVNEYGKVLAIEYYYRSDTSGEFTQMESKDVFAYSEAALLSGDGIVSGYIMEGTGENKSVEITENENGTPVSGAMVSLCAKADDYVFASMTTGDDGFFEFKGVPQGNYYLKVELEGYLQASTYNIEVGWMQIFFENRNFEVQDGNIATGINEKQLQISVFPNPASSFVNINSTATINTVTIFDISGHSRIIKQNLLENNLKLSIESLPPGLYILDVNTNSGTFKKKILKSE